jgi:integrase
LLSRGSLNRITTQLRRVLTFAADREYLRRDQLPDFPRRKADDNPRPTFSNAELTLLIQALRDQCSPTNIANAAIRRDRVLLPCFVGMLVHWGMRPTDLYKLRWGSIEGFPWSEPLESMTEPEELIAAPNQISMLRAEEVRVYAEGKKSPRRSFPMARSPGIWRSCLLRQGATDDDALCPMSRCSRILMGR